MAKELNTSIPHLDEIRQLATAAQCADCKKLAGLVVQFFDVILGSVDYLATRVDSPDDPKPR